MKFDSDNILDVAYFKDWSNSINELENLAAPENWKFSTINSKYRNNNNPILENYVKHTFKRLANEYNNAIDNGDDNNGIILLTNNKLVFNTGLFTKNYASIYGIMTKNKYDSSTKKYYFTGFVDESSGHFDSIPTLPRRAKYFNDITDLIFNNDLPLRVNTYHILEDQDNRNRIPEKFRDSKNLITLFTGAVDLAQKIVDSNYKAAVPQFYNGKISFLLPICLDNPEVADLSLSVIKNENCYIGVTCLTLDMAYNNARLISKPDCEWLKL